ncbi:MAG TPA: hypothetical protein VGO93_27230 [Candidatus Xenobia bacterium]|jgi:hypothetical protein
MTTGSLPYEFALELRRRDRRLRLLAWLYLLLVASVFAYGWGRRNHLARVVPPPPPAAATVSHAEGPAESVAIVNGHPISVRDTEQALDAAAGDRIVLALVEDELIDQEARKRKISLDRTDVDELKAAVEGIDDPNHRLVRAHHLASVLLLRHLVLDPIPTSRRQAIYAEFKNELSLFEVDAMAVDNVEQAQQVLAALHQGTRFAAASARWNRRRAWNGFQSHLGWLTLDDLEERFGSGGVNAAYSRLTGHEGVARPIPIGGGLVILNFRGVRSAWPDLRGGVDRVLVAAGSPAVLHQLHSQARISYPIHDANTRLEVPPDLKEVFAKPTAEPHSSGSPGFLTLPPAIKPSPGATGLFTLPSTVPAASSSPGTFALPPAIHPAKTGIFAPMPERSARPR